MFFFNVDAVVCQNNGQFQVWELNIWQFIVIVEIKYFFNLNEYYLPIFILSIHFRQKITKDIQSNNNNNIVLSMLYAEICPKVRRHNARPENINIIQVLNCFNSFFRFIWSLFYYKYVGFFHFFKETFTTLSNQSCDHYMVAEIRFFIIIKMKFIDHWYSS